MANEKHLAWLKNGVEYWNMKCTETDGLFSTFSLSFPDFEGADLRGLDLRGAQLRHANFEGANLSEVDFRESFIERCNFFNANLTGANFSGLDLSKIYFRETICISTILESCNFYEINCRYGIFMGAKLAHANFQRAILSGSNFEGADLSGVDFSFADLSNALLCDMSSTETPAWTVSTLKDLQWYKSVHLIGRQTQNVPEVKSQTPTNLTRCNLIQCNLSNADLTGAQLIHAVLDKANMNNAILKNCDARFASFSSDVPPKPQIFSLPPIYGADLREADLSRGNFNNANFSYACMDNSNMRWSGFRQAKFHQTLARKADLANADFTESEIIGGNLDGSNLSSANMRRALLVGSSFVNADLGGACMAYADLSSAILVGSHMVGTELSYAKLDSCRVFGASIWNVDLEGATQINLNISRFHEPDITVDNIEVAQFIYLIINNEKLRGIINTLTTKVVLILGRFGEHLDFLEAIRTSLRNKNYIPVLFDFKKPDTRDFSETVSTLAHLARFIIADLTNPSSIPHEIQTIAPNLAVPIKPIIRRGEHPYSMFVDQRKYPWVLPIFEYMDISDLLDNLYERVINPAEQKAQELETR